MKRLVVGGVLLLSTVAGAWWGLPWFITGEIHKRHPEVAFQDLTLGWGQVVLHGVRADKGWIVVEAQLATINVKTEAVHLEHGTIDADWDKKSPSTGVKSDFSSKVTADDFSILLTSKTRGLTVTSTGVRVDEGSVTVKDTHVSFMNNRADLINSVVARDLQHGSTEKIEFPGGLSLGDARLQLRPVLEHVEIDKASQSVLVGRAFFSGEFDQEHAEVEANELLMQRLGATAVNVSIDQLGVTHPWLASSGGVHFQHIKFEGGSSSLREPFNIQVAGVTFHVDPTTLSVEGNESCQAWADAMPPEFHVGPLASVKFPVGNLAFTMGLKPKPTLTLKGSCTSTCDSVTDPRHKFSYITYDKGGVQNVERRITGPDVKDTWTPLSQINPTMPIAVRNMEDFGFYGHHGFLPEALDQSFTADVTSGKLQRGGSTITMQTAKNLWLSREKTFGRKVEELFLSQVLESCLSKDEIMETYLNIVEFGPNVYGVRQAAAHYFKTEPLQLDTKEAFYLAWILPRPRKAPQPTADVMDRMSRLVQMLAGKDRIPETMMLSVEPADTSGWEQAP